MAELLFTPTPEATTEWLTTLQKAGPKSRAHQLYRTIKRLNESPSEAESHLAILETLRHAVFATSEMLAAEFTTKTPPLSESARSTAKLSVFLHHELALGYERLPNDHSPLNRQRALASLGWMMLRIIQLGEPISSSTWRRLLNHYREGENEGWLRLPVKEPLSQLDAFSPVDHIKCILALIALTPMRFDATWLPQCMLYLEKNKDKITISDNPSAACWCFDPERAESSRYICNTPGNDASLRYVHIETREPPELPESIATRWQHQLNQLSELVYQLEKRVEELWCGWECTESELRRRQRNPPTHNEWLSVPDFEVILPDTPFDSTNGETNSDWQRPHRHVNALLKHAPRDLIAIIETHICLRPGDLLGLKLLDETIMLAVIRWAQPGLFGNQGRFGLDLLEGEVRTTTSIVPGLGPGPAIHIVSPENHGVLVVPQVRLKPGVSILVEENEYRIAKLLEWGNDFSAYSLVQ